MKTSIILMLSFFYVLPLAYADLLVGFYGSTCPKAETIIQQAVEKLFNHDKSITAALVRLQFHDCFVRGCDASILIDSRNGKLSEKDAFDSIFLRGFHLIDEIKESLEALCPSTVSCADIVSIAARDAVDLAGGPEYQVPTGRRDGLVSNLEDVKMPQPNDHVNVSLQIFNEKGLTLNDMVTLLGAHTVGVAHCGFFASRLVGNQSDPNMDPALRAKLIKLCFKASRREPSAFLDQNTSFVFDNEFYHQILEKRGILLIDEQLAFDNSTSGIVRNFASDNVGFLQSFAKAMIKMGSIEVLGGNEGEIRKNCRY
ncbi:peroxidase 44-like [Gastrolobium bilobum]|uniref:peroxidase 44-like n=1 Tax=Gastrolobium bilobum TaxID=150636 RepID=UPI002AB28A9D|nr:peroxidase 44-like [Gastrolobium bilobum]